MVKQRRRSAAGWGEGSAAGPPPFGTDLRGLKASTHEAAASVDDSCGWKIAHCERYNVVYGCLQPGLCTEKFLDQADSRGLKGTQGDSRRLNAG